MKRDWHAIYEEFAGKWVAFEDEDSEVVASGRTPDIVQEICHKKGIENPLLHFVSVSIDKLPL